MKPDLMNMYHTLDKLRQRILQVTALAYNIISERYYIGSSILYAHGGLHKKLLSQLTTDNGGRNISERDMILMVNSLAREGFLNKEGECHPALVFPICKIACRPENLKVNLGIVTMIERFKPIPEFTSWRKFDIYDYRSIEHEDFRGLNLAIHTNNVSIFEKSWTSEEQLKIITAYRYIFYSVDIDSEWLRSRQPIFQAIICVVKLSRDLGLNLQPLADHMNWRRYFNTLASSLQFANFPLLEAQKNQLNIAYAKYDNISKPSSRNIWSESFYLATEALLRGEYSEAYRCYDNSVRDFSTLTKRDYWFSLTEASILYTITLIRDNKPTKIETSIISRLERLEQHQRFILVLSAFQAIACDNLNLAKECLNKIQASFQESNEQVTSRDLTEFALFSLLLSKILPEQVSWSNVRKNLELCSLLDVPLALAISAELILYHFSDDKVAQELYAKSPYQGLNITQLITVKADWEYTLDNLSALLSAGASTKPDAFKNRRLAWLLDPLTLEIQIIEQILAKDGQWEAGKEIPISRLARRIDLDYIEKYDTKALLALETDDERKNSYEWNHSRLIMNLVGHPCVFEYSNPEIPIDLYIDTPELYIKQSGNDYFLSLSHVAAESGVYVEKVNAGKYKVINWSPQLVSLSQLIGTSGLIIPGEAKSRLMEVIARNSQVIKIQIELAEDNLVEEEANGQLFFLVRYIEAKYEVNLIMRPFGATDAQFYPGHGEPAKIIEQSNISFPRKIVRNLKEELEAAKKVIDACPVLLTSQISQYVWRFDDKETCLQFLSEIKCFEDNGLVLLEWPETPSVKLKANLDKSKLVVNIDSQREWLRFEGQFILGSEAIINLQSLLEHISQANSRFIEFASNEHIAISEGFKNKLLQLTTVSDDGLTMHYLHYALLKPIVDLASEVYCDELATKLIANFGNIQLPNLRLQLTAKRLLRGYQETGVLFMYHLLRNGYGACLADETGLGKTIQGLALLIEMAKSGPSLVMATANECITWQNLAARFVPELNLKIIETQHFTNKRFIFDSLAAYDLVICSYGFLENATDLLTKIKWNVLILDEVQENSDKLAERISLITPLHCQHKIVLSSIPLAKQQETLWQVFHFLNPELFGNLAHYESKFIKPIHSGNKFAQTALEHIVRPFLLRRTKLMVSEELPKVLTVPKFIEPTPAEHTFYELIRKQALSNLIKQDQEKFDSQAFLTEIQKIYQSHVSPLLINPEVNLEHSRLAEVVSIVRRESANYQKGMIICDVQCNLEILTSRLNENNLSFQVLDLTQVEPTGNTVIEEFSIQSSVLIVSGLTEGFVKLVSKVSYVVFVNLLTEIEFTYSNLYHEIINHIKEPLILYQLALRHTIEEKIFTLAKDKQISISELLLGKRALVQEDLVYFIDLIKN